ncbi:ribose ABC transporter permease [Anaeromicrobium sediminis]|uniref:Ribose ABC transporter permease n=1 Tax=Anaeromicrobium sediminis TaxID=1478221 RepID=A0A267MM67_9FIRM|nr:ribose ABC transporter permease [Anaeromicrobium sediminis]PAB60502.1 ribose ABC transporter permease [Anaeromicrobium sediminis]
MKINKDFLVKYKSVIALVIFSAIISMLNARFLTTSNILNILRQTTINGVIAAGMTFVILTGGIDLSVGSVVAFSGAVGAYLIASGSNVVVAVIGALVIGTIIGLINGIIITKGKVQPFIVTLATMTLLRGGTLVFTNGKPISLGYEKNADLFSAIGGGYLFKIPVPIYILIAVFILAYYVLTNTRLGRYTYALGGNEQAAKLSGINTEKMKCYIYMISGALAALAGVILTSRLSSAQPTAGSGYELDAIAAVVLGGTSLAGGVGSVFGTVIGALIIGVLSNALNLMNVTSYYQLMAKGIVILIAVLLDRKQK